MIRRLSLISAALLAGASAAAPAAESPKNTVSATYATDSLDNGTDDWRESGLQYRRVLAPRTLASVGVSQTRRFDLSDTQLAAALAGPLTDKLIASVDASYSSSHKVLARNAIGTNLQYEFAPSWLLHGGARTTSYDIARVNQTSLMLEHYFSDFSAAVSWQGTRVLGATANGYAVQGAWYYGDRDLIGVTLGSGEEPSSVPGGVQLGKVKAVALTGRHMLTPALALNYGLSRSRQSGLYERKGFSMGLGYSY